MIAKSADEGATPLTVFLVHKNQPVSISPLAVSFFDAALTPLVTATFDLGTFDGGSQPWRLRVQIGASLCSKPLP